MESQHEIEIEKLLGKRAHRSTSIDIVQKIVFSRSIYERPPFSENEFF